MEKGLMYYFGNFLLSMEATTDLDLLLVLKKKELKILCFSFVVSAVTFYYS